jgi:L-rhamnose-H+ transport protein
LNFPEEAAVHRDFALGVLMGVLAGLVNGIFLLPMRYTRKWAWENVWLIFTILSTFVFPWIAAMFAVPHVMAIFRASSLSYLVVGLIAGTVWGIAQVLYGLGCGMIGIAIGSAIIACTAIISGTIGPIIAYAPEELISFSSIKLLIAVVLIVMGIYLYGKAGARKETETGGAGIAKQIVRGNLRTGLIICLISGVLGTAFIYGGKSSTAILAAARAAGAPSLVAFYAAYVVTFNAGTVPGVIYSIYKLHRNNTAANYARSGSLLLNVALTISMALLWYGGILLYGMSSEEMGKLGPSIAFALFASGTVLFANLFGWLAGEWEGASHKTIRGFVKGMALIVLAVLIIAFGIRSPS